MSTDSEQFGSRQTSSPRVVDFSTHFSGPLASWHMAQLGADVIKVEHPRFGDGNRGFPPIFEGLGIHHLHLNVGTRSFALEPLTDLWHRSIPALARWADVVIVGNRPERARKLKIDAPSMLHHNPRLTYCLISGYGVTGEWASMPAHGLNMDALAGALPLQWKDSLPEIPSTYRSAGTTLAGVHAALGIYAALHRRDAEGDGQVVQLSIWESAFSWMWRDVITQANLGTPWTNYQDLGPRYAVYCASDGKPILVCPIEQKFWRKFCDVIGLPKEVKSRGEWSGGTDAGAKYESLGERTLIQQKISQRPSDEWLAAMSSAGIPAAPVLTCTDVMNSPHALDNGVMGSYQIDARTVRVPTTPISITPAHHVLADEKNALANSHKYKSERADLPPTLGQHNEQIMETLGIVP